MGHGNDARIYDEPRFFKIDKSCMIMKSYRVELVLPGVGYTRTRMARAFSFSTLLLAAAARALVSPGSLNSDLSILIHNDLLGRRSLSIGFICGC